MEKFLNYMKYACLLLFAAAFSVVMNAQNTNSIKPAKYTDPGVVIGGIMWATRNVDAPGTFASQPESTGMYYQWNRKVGWSITDPLVNNNGGTAWDSSDSSGSTWEKANDPCPSGWRVPTMSELESLANAGSKWITMYGVDGRVFGSGANTVFLPASGSRYNSGRLHTVDGDYAVGDYWSGSPSSKEDGGYQLSFDSSDIYPTESVRRSNGFTVRCVKK